LNILFTASIQLLPFGGLCYLREQINDRALVLSGKVNRARAEGVPERYLQAYDRAFFQLANELIRKDWVFQGFHSGTLIFERKRAGIEALHELGLVNDGQLPEYLQVLLDGDNEDCRAMEMGRR